MLKLSLVAATGLVALAALSAGAQAAPLSSRDLDGRDVGIESLIQPVHGCHRDVQEGRRGWHYHAGYNCDRIAVPPPRRHYQHRPEFRRPVCRQQCKYIGPIKVCEDRCY